MGSYPHTWTVLTMARIQLKNIHNPELTSFFFFLFININNTTVTEHKTFWYDIEGLMQLWVFFCNFYFFQLNMGNNVHIIRIKNATSRYCELMWALSIHPIRGYYTTLVTWLIETYMNSNKNWRERSFLEFWSQIIYFPKLDISMVPLFSHHISTIWEHVRHKQTTHIQPKQTIFQHTQHK